jgi:hypothetical protein
MSWFFNKKAEKREVEHLKQAVQTGFNTAKQDIGNISTWIKHLDAKDSELNSSIQDLKEDISSMKEEIENLKNVMSLVGERPVFKQKQTVFNKQTPVKSVLNTVQTPVQTALLDNLSITERAIVFVLLNAEMKLSYEDLAAILGKNKATIRGQINSIRQKSEGLIEEMIGESNKKRVYIPDRVRELLQKTRKVRSRERRSNERSEIDNE